MDVGPDVVGRARRDVAWWVTLGREGSDERTRSRGWPRSGGSTAGIGRLPALAPSCTRGASHPHLPGGGGRVRTAGPALLGWQGLRRDAPCGQEGLLARSDPLPGPAHRHREELRRGVGVQGPARGRSGGQVAGGQRPGGHRRRPHHRGARDAGHPQSPPDADPPAGHRRREVRCGLRRGPPGRGEGAGQGTDLQLPRRVRPVGPQETATRTVEPLQRATSCGRAHPGLPPLELDRARCVAVHRRREHRGPVHLLLPPPPRVPA